MLLCSSSRLQGRQRAQLSTARACQVNTPHGSTLLQDAVKPAAVGTAHGLHKSSRVLCQAQACTARHAAAKSMQHKRVTRMTAGMMSEDSRSGVLAESWWLSLGAQVMMRGVQ